ncbi:hypothetical protein KC329_g109 [Hortaea werneckii]|nr:hypothetical protein KC329_g109 [Hortaea werneckii]
MRLSSENSAMAPSNPTPTMASVQGFPISLNLGQKLFFSALHFAETGNWRQGQLLAEIVWMSDNAPDTACVQVRAFCLLVRFELPRGCPASILRKFSCWADKSSEFIDTQGSGEWQCNNGLEHSFHAKQYDSTPACNSIGQTSAPYSHSTKQNLLIEIKTGPCAPKALARDHVPPNSFFYFDAVRRPRDASLLVLHVPKIYC